MLAGAVAASAGPGDDWIQVRTRNFFLIGNAPEADVRQAAIRLEQLRGTVRQLFPQIKLDGGVRTNVVIFRDSAAYAPFKPRRPDGSADTGIAGFFQAGDNVNYITLSTGEKAAYNTVYHEYVHYLLDTNIGRSDLPPWLGEGLAEYFETIQILDAQRVSLGAAPGGHLALLRRSEFIPFSELFSTDQTALHRGADDSRTLFYAQSWAVTHYLLHAGAGGGVPFERLLAEVKGYDSLGKASERLFGKDREALSKAVREHIDQPQLPGRLVHLQQRIAFDSDIAVSPLSEAQAAAYLGDLLYHMGRTDEAETHLRKALRLEPNLALANITLGLVAAGRRDFAGARVSLEKALAADKANHFAWFNYAYALSRESMDENGSVSEYSPATTAKMIDALDRALALDPNFAESYRLLAFVLLVNDTNLDRAVDLLNRGLAIRPGDPHFRLVLAQVYLRQEKYDAAGQIAEKLAAGASDAEIWAGAQSVLHTVNQYHAVSAVKPNEAEVAKDFGRLPPLILKRSTLSETDVARYEQERVITNLNIMVPRPRFGEKQVVGYIERIACSDDEITYAVRAGDEKFNLSSRGFSPISLRVLTEGSSSFTLDCGVSFSKQLTVLTYAPSVGPRPGSRGRLLSISFVPEIFRLKTAQEMAATRTVIIEDDRLFRSRGARTN